MEPVSIVVICAVSFGGLVTIASLIHQQFLSRNQSLHQLAEERAMRYHQMSLERMRREIKKDKFKEQYALLNDNKEAIRHIDEDINKLMGEKIKLIKKFSKLIESQIKERENHFFSRSFQKKLKQLKASLSMALTQYDERISQRQSTRSELFLHNKEIEVSIRLREIEQNKALNDLYKQHSRFLEKIQLKQSEYRYSLAQSIISATTRLFDKLILSPAKLISAYFSPSSSANTKKVSEELTQRQDILSLETRLNIQYGDEYLKAELSI